MLSIHRAGAPAAAILVSIFLLSPVTQANANTSRAADKEQAATQKAGKSSWQEKLEESRKRKAELKKEQEAEKKVREAKKQAMLKRAKERREAKLLERKQALAAAKKKKAENKKPGGLLEKLQADGKNSKDTNKKKRVASKPKGKKGGLSSLIAKYASQHGVPYKLASAVVQVESSFRPNATGAAGEIGLMQIKLSTARGMGYSGSKRALYDPATNLYWGMKYLGKAHQLSGGSTCGTILKYNAGHYAKRSNPISSRYCRKVKQII